MLHAPREYIAYFQGNCLVPLLAYDGRVFSSIPSNFSPWAVHVFWNFLKDCLFSDIMAKLSVEKFVTSIFLYLYFTYSYIFPILIYYYKIVFPG